MSEEFHLIHRRGFLAALGGLPVWAQEATEVVAIGGVRFEVVRNGNRSRRYLHIHGNETTARDVLREHMARFEGTGYFVVSNQRNVNVSGGCAIDPNRMFTRAGAEKSLRRYSQGLTPEQHSACESALAEDRGEFITRLTPPGNGLLVAMHNNGPGYSVHSEVGISDAVALNDEANPREFMLATNEEDFRKLAAGAFNVVLQKTVRVDDGSFSVIANLRGIRYVNIEASLGKKAEQRAMLEYLESVLP